MPPVISRMSKEGSNGSGEAVFTPGLSSIHSGRTLILKEIGKTWPLRLLLINEVLHLAIRFMQVLRTDWLHFLVLNRRMSVRGPLWYNINWWGKPLNPLTKKPARVKQLSSHKWKQCRSKVDKCIYEEPQKKHIKEVQKLMSTDSKTQSTE